MSKRLVEVLKERDRAAASKNGRKQATLPTTGPTSEFDDRLPAADRAGQQSAALRPKFAAPLPASALRATSEEASWIWRGLLAPGAVTLFSSLPKAGKTTLLSHLLRARERGGDCCGRPVAAGRVLYVTEESESLWAKRRDELRLADHTHFLIRPFIYKPSFPAWVELLDHLATVLTDRPADLIVMDTLSNLWPVRDENDAAQVGAALMPLHRLTAGAALLLAHHLRKGDGQEGSGARGSGALAGFVDIILELRRHSPGDRQDRRRVLTGFGRWEDVPAELVLELGADGYVSHGDRQHVARQELTATIKELLPRELPGMTVEDVRGNWPDDPAPGKKRLLDALRAGLERGDWRRAGDGCKGSPFLFRVGP